jgi:hypothetical protein
MIRHKSRHLSNPSNQTYQTHQTHQTHLTYPTHTVFTFTNSLMPYCDNSRP